MNIAAFTCTKPCRLTIHVQQPLPALTVRPKHRQIAVTGKEPDWTLELPGPWQLYVELGSLPPLLIFADPPEANHPVESRVSV